MSAQTQVHPNKFKIEASLKECLKSMSVYARRKCLSTIRWFEHQLPAHNRSSRSSSIFGASLRRLRYVKASNDLRVVYVPLRGDEILWIWAGTTEALRDNALLIDAEPPAIAEETDSETLWGLFANATTDQNDPASPVVETKASPAMQEVNRLNESVDNIALHLSDARSLAAALHEKIQLLKQEQKANAKLSGLSVPIEEFNALRAERDRLLAAVAVERKRATNAEMTAARSVQKMAAEELNIQKKEADRLRTELAAARTAVQRGVNSALDEQAKERLKDLCAKVCDDQAKKLASLGRPTLDEQADELWRIAKTIRALKL